MNKIQTAENMVLNSEIFLRASNESLNKIADLLRSYHEQFGGNITVEEEKMNDVFTKYHVRGLPRDIVLHHFTGLDNENPHDHPYTFHSLILVGGYIERIYFLDGGSIDVNRKEDDFFEVKADTIHQILEFPAGECWTLILPGPKEKKSGFYQMGEEVLHRYWDETEFKPFNQKL